MRAIWKYPLFMGMNDVEMPVGSKVISVENQAGILTMWALVDTDKEAAKVTRTFSVKGTGFPIKDNEEHIGTWQQPPYVWHLFEVNGESTG